MPTITGVATALSLDVTANLVAQGIGPYDGSWPLEVIGASNTTPIVLTLAANHNLVLPVHVVVSGITGNTGANSTNAPWAAWIASPNGSLNELTLTTMNPDGTYANSVGNGSYTGGGTVQTALVGGRIWLGRQHGSDNSAAPWMSLTPRTSKFTASTQAMRGGRPSLGLKGSSSQTPEMVREQTIKMIAQEDLMLEVNVWGQANPPDPYIDFDITQQMYQQFIRTCEHTIQGAYRLTEGEWPDQVEGQASVADAGHVMRFGIIVLTPIADYVLGVAKVDTITGTVNLQNPTGSPEVAWNGTIISLAPLG